MFRSLWPIWVPLAAAVAWAQTFDAASLKPCGPQSDNRIEGGPGSADPLRYTYTSATLEDLIVTAWNLEYFQVLSKAPIDRGCFDLLAKIPPDTTKEDFRRMLQSLLADRFHLKLHRERRQFAGYALVVGKRGFRQSPVTGALGEFPAMPAQKRGIATQEIVREGHVIVRMRAQKMPMPEIARSLHVPSEVPVSDQTGLTDTYDLTLEYCYPARNAQTMSEAPPAPSIFTAVQQQLGLQLVASRVSHHVMVIDSFDRIPLGN